MKRLILLICLAGLFLCSCGLREEKNDKVQDLDFTVADQKDLPQELLNLIEEKKTSEMKSTYTTGGYLYIIVGYGEQKTSGYSIAVDECYLGKNAVFINTSLIGPSKDDKVSETPTYPYVVVKMQQREEPVVFQ